MSTNAIGSLNNINVMDLRWKENESILEYALRKRKAVDGTQQRRFNCPHCNKRYMNRIGLKKHVEKMHDTQPPYRTQENALSTPYYCKNCEVRYRSRAGLYLHVQRHHPMNTVGYEEKPGGTLTKLQFPRQRLRCPSCDNSYVSEQKLRQHMVSIHMCGSNPKRLPWFRQIRVEETSEYILTCEKLVSARSRSALNNREKSDLLNDNKVANFLYVALKLLPKIRRKKSALPTSTLQTPPQPQPSNILPLTSFEEFLLEIESFAHNLSAHIGMSIERTKTTPPSPPHTPPEISLLRDQTVSAADDPTAVEYEPPRRKRARIPDEERDIDYQEPGYRSTRDGRMV